MNRIAIVGGGITGLAAALELERTSDVEIDLYEAADSLGGKVRTHRQGGFFIEEGPDCFFARRPGILELIEELGISDELIKPQADEFSILVGGELHRVPRGLTNLVSPSAEGIRAATFLSESAKARALAAEAVEVDGDISIRACFSKRFGPEFSRLVAEPLLAGTHGGGPDRLSMRALYPAYLDAYAPGPMGTPDASARARKSDSPQVELSEPQLSSGPTFLSFRDGMQTLVRALAGSLGRTEIHLGRPLSTLPDADRVLVAVPAPAASRLVPNPMSELLSTIPHREAHISTEAYEKDSLRELPTGTGFLVPEGEGTSVSGATWSSVKWAGRAPDGAVLIRSFLRPEADPQTLNPDEEGAWSWRGPNAKALFFLHHGWPNALPQYELGHLDRLAEIEEAMGALPHVFLAGTSYRGVGVPDCLRQGREAARKMLASL